MRTLPWLALAAAIVPASCSIFGGGARPNLLLITVDSLRFDAISRSLGAANTPNVRALEAEGQSFTHCFSHSPTSLPAHVALFSSRLPHQSGVTGNGMPIDPDVTLLPEWMRSRGYSTAAAVSSASLWPPRAGDHASETYEDREHLVGGLDRGFGSYAMSEDELAPATEINERLLAQLDALPPNQPWFLFAEYCEPHAPYDAWDSGDVHADVLLDGTLLERPVVSGPGRWSIDVELAPGTHELSFRCADPIQLRRLACHGPNGDLVTRFVRGELQQPGKQIVAIVESSEPDEAHCTLDVWLNDVPELAKVRERYKLEVEAVDRALGELIQGLKQRGLYENTTIVFTAVYGEALGEHGTIGHAASLYDEVLRVPMIIKPHKGCADFIELARLKHAPMRQIDIVPTVLDLLDIRALPGSEGSSLLVETDRTQFAEVHPPEAPNTVLSRRDDHYKLIFTAGENRWEFYDLTSDTLEADNVFENQGHFRSNWQRELGMIALSSPDAANTRMGLSTERPATLEPPAR